MNTSFLSFKSRGITAHTPHVSLSLECIHHIPFIVQSQHHGTTLRFAKSIQVVRSQKWKVVKADSGEQCLEHFNSAEVGGGGVKGGGKSRSSF